LGRGTNNDLAHVNVGRLLDRECNGAGTSMDSNHELDSAKAACPGHQALLPNWDCRHARSILKSSV
jgi:hypothetical protein